MNRTSLMWVLLLAAASARGQVGESLADWRFYQELSGTLTERSILEVDDYALDGAREDHADLRLYDANGREIPYALRIRREVHTSDAYEASEINRGARDGGAEVTLDLGAQSSRHNEVEIDTAGEGFRRAVRLEGSRDGRDWLVLEPRGLVFRFSSGGRGVDERRVGYPESDFRYLRVRVEADPQTDSGPPHIVSATVRRTVRTEARERDVYLSYPAREPTRDQGREASAYRMSAPGRVPLHGLKLQLGGGPFSRPYRLEAIEPAGRRVPLASGTLAAGEEAEDVTLRFDERFVSEIELIVTDDRNAAVQLSGATGLSAVRQLVFDGRAAAPFVRLYFGNPSAQAPRYDIEASVPLAPPDADPVFYAGPRMENPDYRPPTQPLTERVPWAIYLILAVAAAAIFVLLRKVVAETAGQA